MTGEEGSPVVLALSGKNGRDSAPMWQNSARGRFDRLEFAPGTARAGTRWPRAWRDEPFSWTTGLSRSATTAEGSSTSAPAGDPTTQREWASGRRPHPEAQSYRSG